MSAEGLRAAEEKMRREGVPEVFVDTFRHYYRQLEQGVSGLLPDSELEPVGELPSAAELPARPEAERDALGRAVAIKLNGGLGTSMGMTGPKSLLPVKEGLTFLDIVARQVLELRRRTGARLPLVLMNSFSTREETLASLARHPELAEGQDVPLDFVQHKEPKLLASDLEPVSWPPDPELEWAPPGHGDLYTALVTSGMLESLLGGGYAHAFVSNIDNLGAVLEPRILAWMDAERAPFLMEVADRTRADRKGGHLARGATADGLVLREIAQTPEEDLDSFQDTGHGATSTPTPSGWTCACSPSSSRARDDVLGLPMIVNRKTVDPSDSDSPEVIQIETAMGAAIGRLRGRPRAARRAHALRAGQDDQRPARAALRRLRAHRRGPRGPQPAPGRARCCSSTSTPSTTSSSPTSSSASRRGRRRWSSATVSWCAATCGSGGE